MSIIQNASDGNGSMKWCILHRKTSIIVY